MPNKVCQADVGFFSSLTQLHNKILSNCPELKTVWRHCKQRQGLAMWRKSVIRLPVTEVKFITKSSLFILLPGVVRRLELKLNGEKKAEYIFVAPPYSQAACWL